MRKLSISDLVPVTRTRTLASAGLFDSPWTIVKKLIEGAKVQSDMRALNQDLAPALTSLTEIRSLQ